MNDVISCYGATCRNTGLARVPCKTHFKIKMELYSAALGSIHQAAPARTIIEERSGCQSPIHGLLTYFQSTGMILV